MITRVQICGVKSLKDAKMCADLGVDGIGLVNVEGRSRSISLDKIKTIIRGLGPYTSSTLITFSQDAEEIIEKGRYVNADILQLYSVGFEEIKQIKKADFKVIKTYVIKLDNKFKNIDLDEIKKLNSVSDLILFEPEINGKIGGLGHKFDYIDKLHSIAEEIERFGIGGGLTPENVKQVIKLQPYSVNVSSGVECKKCKKDKQKVKKFIQKVKS